MIDAFIGVHLGVARRSLPLLKVTFEAATIDGEVAKEYEKNEEHRYQAQQVLIDALHRKGLLRTDVALDYLERGFWLLAGPQMLIAATNAGWDINTYARWLRDTVSGLSLIETVEGQISWVPSHRWTGSRHHHMVLARARSVLARTRSFRWTQAIWGCEGCDDSS